MFGLFKTEYTVETYGKMPFYKDYINVITSPEAGLWQEWLLEVFGEKGALIPGGIWHFLFCPAKGAHLVMGIIVQGSDGLRNFPFSLFVTLNKPTIKTQMKWAELFVIKDRLTGIYNALCRAEDIDSCYTILSRHTLEIHKSDIKSMCSILETLPDLNPFINDTDDGFPVFSILSEYGITGLSRGSVSGHALCREWEKLTYTPNIKK